MIISRLFENAVAHQPDGRGQIPLLERHAVAECARFALQDRQIMPRIADQLITPIPAGVFGHDCAVGHDAHASGRGTHRDSAAGEGGWHAVSVAIHGDQAGARHAQHMLDVAVERRGDLPERRLLLGEARGNRALRRHRMFALRQLPAARGQPFIQRVEAGKAG